MAVFPLETYPGKTQEGLLGQLLRKKLEPEVEDWVAQGRHAAEEAGMGDEDRKEKMEELWSWAGMAANELARGHEWGGEFTREEKEKGVENVQTGLMRRRRGGVGELGEEEEEEEEEEEDDDDDEEEEAEEDKMEIVQMQTDVIEGAAAAAEGGNELKIPAEHEDEKKPESKETTPPLPPPLSLEQVLKFLVTGIEPNRLI